MTSKVQKWGNSLAVRIPKSIALDANLICGGGVAFSVTSAGVLLKAVKTKKTLDEVIAGITKKNRHRAADCGSIGREAW